MELSTSGNSQAWQDIENKNSPNWSQGQLRSQSNHWRRRIRRNAWIYWNIPSCCVTHSVWCVNTSIAMRVHCKESQVVKKTWKINPLLAIFCTRKSHDVTNRFIIRKPFVFCLTTCTFLTSSWTQLSNKTKFGIIVCFNLAILCTVALKTNQSSRTDLQLNSEGWLKG